MFEWLAALAALGCDIRVEKVGRIRQLMLRSVLTEFPALSLEYLLVQV